MVDQIQQTTPLNLPNPRTPLIRFQVSNGQEVLGYPTREFMALLRQLSVRVGGTGGDVDIITPDSDIMPSPDFEGAAQDGAMATEMVLLSIDQLQEMIAQAVAIEMEMARAPVGAPEPLFPDVPAGTEQTSSPLSMEMTMGQGFEPV